MDTFITTIMVLYDNINKEKQEGPKLINNKITEKQFLAYYIYRIWIKYRKLMENANTPTEFHKILLYMEIPKKYHEFYLTYPMANKMTLNEKQLDLIILSILKQFNTAYKIFSPRKDGSMPPENKEFKELTKYLTGKSIENIVQDVIQIKLLVPNLARPANVRNMWDGIDQMIDDIDVINPVEFPNPANEIPDTKIIQNSNLSSKSNESVSMSNISKNSEFKSISGDSNSMDKTNIPTTTTPTTVNTVQEVKTGTSPTTTNTGGITGNIEETKPPTNINKTNTSKINANKVSKNKITTNTSNTSNNRVKTNVSNSEQKYNNSLSSNLKKSTLN
jgi:hypothetical protein